VPWVPKSATARQQQLLGAVIAALLIAGIVGSMRVPGGASSATEVVPDGARVATQTTVGTARILLVDRTGRLQLVVAHRRDGRWFGVEVDPPPPDSAAAWAATRGGGGVPPLSVVYGRSKGAGVRVTWADGKAADVTPTADGSWLVARTGHVRSRSVTVSDAGGAVVTEIKGP
jgi:hypothetical protein